MHRERIQWSSNGSFLLRYYYRWWSYLRCLKGGVRQTFTAILGLPQDGRSTFLSPIEAQWAKHFFRPCSPRRSMFMHCGYYSNTTIDSLETQNRYWIHPWPIFSFSKLNILFPYPSRILYLKTVTLELHGVGVSHLNQGSFKKMHTSEWKFSFLVKQQMPSTAEPLWVLSGTVHWLFLRSNSKF